MQKDVGLSDQISFLDYQLFRMCYGQMLSLTQDQSQGAQFNTRLSLPIKIGKHIFDFGGEKFNE